MRSTVVFVVHLCVVCTMSFILAAWVNKTTVAIVAAQSNGNMAEKNQNMLAKIFQKQAAI